MKNIILFIFLSIGISSSCLAQILPLTVEPDGNNKKGSVSEQIGIVKINISYGRPGVKGREGKIWNTSVAHYGFMDLGHGTSTAAPWRAGANENTTISFSHPVQIEGKDIPAGTYGFFIALGETESTLIFSNINNSWGSFYYDSTQDALRVKVRNETLNTSVEWLRYDFTDETQNSAVVALSWEKRRIPFKISADVQKLQIESFKSELRTTRPPTDFIQAAYYCINNNIALDQALAWMDRAIYFRIMGVKNFRNLSVKAMVLRKMNRQEDAKKVMEEAIPLATMNELMTYGRILINEKQFQESLRIFQLAYDKNPNIYLTNLGLARGYAATGDLKKGLEYMRLALAQTPTPAAKTYVESLIKKLESGDNNIN